MIENIEFKSPSCRVKIREDFKGAPFVWLQAIPAPNHEGPLYLKLSADEATLLADVLTEYADKVTGK